jgi:hypothetical protein
MAVELCFKYEVLHGRRIIQQSLVAVACVQLLPYGEPVPLEESLGEVTDLAIHPTGFCIAICTGNGHMKVFDVRSPQLRCHSLSPLITWPLPSIKVNNQEVAK